jgi:hypothetical protein
LLIPVYSSGQTLLEENGNSFAWILIAPPLVASLSLVPGPAHRQLVWTSAVLLAAFALVGSAGLFYIPSAALLIWAAVQLQRSPAS